MADVIGMEENEDLVMDTEVLEDMKGIFCNVEPRMAIRDETNEQSLNTTQEMDRNFEFLIPEIKSERDKDPLQCNSEEFETKINYCDKNKIEGSNLTTKEDEEFLEQIFGCNLQNGGERNNNNEKETIQLNLVDDAVIESPNPHKKRKSQKSNGRKATKLQKSDNQKDQNQFDLDNGVHIEMQNAPAAAPEMQNSLEVAPKLQNENEIDIIEDLLKKPFNQRYYAEQKIIVEKGRPCPDLTIKQECIERNKKYLRTFRFSQYELHLWLAGSSKKNALFCWPCLLFSNANSTWNRTGFSNLSNLNHSQEKHKNSSAHLQSAIDMFQFSKQKHIEEALNSQLKISNSEHNKKVEKNRKILQRLIDIICFLANQGLNFWLHKESDTYLNKVNYLETLNLLINYDSILKDYLDTMPVFKDTLSAIQNDLIEAISKVIEDEIFKEITEAPFVAIMLDETSDVETLSQLSTVIRYVHNGKIKERFLGFTDISADRTADRLFKHIESVIKKFKLENKLVAQSYDGAVVMSGQINDLQKKVILKYPYAQFVHSYTHVLNLVLSQSFADIAECKVFFKTLNGMSTFTLHTSRKTCTLKEFLKIKNPKLAKTECAFNSQLVNIVDKYFKDIREYFEYVKTSGESNVTDKMAAIGYLKFLSKFETIFLLKIFSSLHMHTDIILKPLQQKNVDIMYCVKKIEDFKIILQEKRDNGFDQYWKDANNIIDLDGEGKCKHCNLSSTLSKENYRKLYFQIIDHTKCYVDDRFKSLEKLEFIELLNATIVKNSVKKEKYLQKLMNIYNHFFDCVKLKNEIAVFFSKSFEQKPVMEIMEIVGSTELRYTFKELYKLCCLICTIPAATSYVESSLSALNRIHSYIRSTQMQDIMGSLAIIIIEKDLFFSLKNDSLFYDNVIKKISTINYRIEFTYK